MKGIGRGRCEEERKRKTELKKEDPGSLFKQFFFALLFRPIKT